MASEFYGYFDSVTDDEREYDGADFAHILRAAVRNGVTSHNNCGLSASAVGGNMQTGVSPGGCVINGYLYVLEDDGGAPKTFTHTASASNDRIDRIVIRLDLTGEERKISMRLLAGVPGASPEPPALVRNASVYDLSLAQIRIRASTESIEAADITDERGDESVCGYAVPVRLSQEALDGRYAGRGVATSSSNGLMAAADKAAHDALVTNAVRKADVDNSLTVTDAGKALDARQGKALNDKVTAKASTATYHATLTVDGWSAATPYFQTVAVTGLLATDNPMVDLNGGNGTNAAMLENYGFIGRIVTANGSITAYCYEDKPTVALPIQLKVVR